MAKQKRTTKPNSPTAGESPAGPPPSASVGSRTASTLTKTEQELLRSAARKRQTGQVLNREETRVLRKYEAEQEEINRWKYYRTIPKKHFVEMSGRQHKSLGDLARNYGFPLDGPIVDLPAFVHFFCTFMAQNGQKLLSDPDGDLENAADESPMLERLRKEKWRLARLDRRERENQLLPRAKVHETLAILAELIRGVGDKLQKNHGAEAARALNETMDSFATHVDSLLKNGRGS